MRFIAAFLVFLFHFAFEGPFRDTAVGRHYLDVVGQLGPLGVGFFFVLSGFVLTWTARPGERAPDFWRRRAAKIYPNHLLVWVAAFALMGWAGESIAWRSALPNFFLLHPWFPQQKIFFSMDDVTWSLGCEVLFYLSFPLLHRGLVRISDRWLWPAAGAVAVAIVGMIPTVASLLPAHPQFMGTPALRLWFVYIFPPVRALDFFLGMIMAQIVLKGRWVRVGMLPALVLLAAGYLVSKHVPLTFTYVASTVIPLALLIPAAATADLRGTWSPFRGQVMVWLGEVSFAFYLVHRLVLQYGHRALGEGSAWSTPTAVGGAALGLAVSVLLAWALYSLVERPALRRFGRRRRARVEEPQAAPTPAPMATPVPVAEPTAAPAAGPLPAPALLVEPLTARQSSL
jgi:peptidoglycan/LPS O-acetylase OafA/YrhL